MPLSSLPQTRGLVLAAGAGTRMGGPKALLRLHPSGPTLVERAIDVLQAGGCAGVTVVVGAAADEVTELLLRPTSPPTRVGALSTGGPSLVPRATADPPTRVGALSTGAVTVDVVRCEDWAEGMGASLRTGLVALTARPEVSAVIVTLVDLPDLNAEVVARLLDRPHPDSAPEGGEDRVRVDAGLSRAAYAGVPGHPALIGRAHWEGVVAVARGDRGARDYFATHPHVLVECGDLASGRDADTPADLDR